MSRLHPTPLRTIVVLIFLSFSLIGCGGGSSSSSVQDGNLQVAGTVEDGPLQGAVVILYDKLNGQVAEYCGASGRGRCEAVSDEDGSFSFSIIPGVYLPNFYVQATSGLDTATGADFSSVALRAPLAMFSGNESQVVVSPLTTLLQEQVNQGSSLEDAWDTILLWLNLPSTSDLSASPSSNPELLRRALLLTKIMLESRNAGMEDPLVEIGQSLLPGRPLITSENQFDSTALTFLHLDQDSLDAIADTFSALQNADTDLSGTFQRQEFIQQTTAILNRMLQGNSSFDSTDTNYLANARTLAEDILTAAGDTIIPLGGQVPAKLLKYVFFAYDLISFDTEGNIEPTNFLLSSTEFSALLVHSETSLPLTYDTEIKTLAASKTAYSISVPLLSDEMPGDDNLKRAQYYYQSDASHLYQAERVVSEVFDDEINDAILLEVVKGKASAGLIDDAVDIIENQMWLTIFKGNGFIEIANALSGLQRQDETTSYLAEAETFLKLAVEKIGPANITEDIAKALQSLSKAYLTAGNLDGAYNIVSYLYSEIALLTTDVVDVYNRTFVATRNIFDVYLEQGYQADVLSLANILLDLAWTTPYDTAKSAFKSRVLNLGYAAERFAELGDTSTVYSIYQEVLRLRSEPDKTLTQTNAYMPALSLVLYSSGFQNDALALIGTLSSLDKSKALKQLAGYLAVKEGLGESHLEPPLDLADYSALDLVAFKMITDLFNTTVEDSQIEALTYFAANKSVPYIGLNLILADRFDEADQALQLAVALVDQLAPDHKKPFVGGAKVDFGYAKIADLYIDIAENNSAAGNNSENFYTKAQDLLVAGETAIGEMTDTTLQASGRTALAEVYLRLGNITKAEDLLQRAASIDEYSTVVKSFITLGKIEKALVYLNSYYFEAQEIFNLSTPVEDHDTSAMSEISHLLKVASFYVQLGYPASAKSAIDLALTTTREIYLTSKKNDYLLMVVEAYSGANEFDSAISLANSSSDFPYTNQRYEALLQIAEAYSSIDAFTDTTVASVDTDRDGKPDFFNPLATAEEIAASGLELDDDCDGDGIPDSEDHRPLYAD